MRLGVKCYDDFFCYLNDLTYLFIVRYYHRVLAISETLLFRIKDDSFIKILLLMGKHLGTLANCNHSFLRLTHYEIAYSRKGK